MDLTELSGRIAALDDVIRPIANRPVDISDPNWAAKARSQELFNPPLLAEIEKLASELIECYSSRDEGIRQEIRAMFERNRAFRWASGFRQFPSTALELRRALVLFSMKDQGDDPRDAWMELCDLKKRAEGSGISFKELCEEAAELSSTVKRSSWGSTREMLLGKRVY